MVGMNVSRTRPYQIWSAIRKSVLKTGLPIEESWVEDFQAFISDVGEYPGKGHSLELIEEAKGYRPGNCRWILNSRESKPFVQLQFKIPPEIADFVKANGGSELVRWIIESFYMLETGEEGPTTSTACRKLPSEVIGEWHRSKVAPVLEPIVEPEEVVAKVSLPQESEVSVARPMSRPTPPKLTVL
jgi:hypothetical protein